MTILQQLILEIHEPEKSSYNFNWRWDKLVIVTQGIRKMMQLRVKVSDRLNFPNNPCTNDEDYSEQNCVDDFMQWKLGCNFPWKTKNSSQPDQRICDRPVDMDRYYMLYVDTPMEELAEFGCKRDNCKNTYWERVWTDDIVGYDINENVSEVQLFLQANTPTSIVKQNLAYTFPNFVADFGGYLGLLLGASVLSIFDSLWSLFDRLNKQKGIAEK